MEFFSSFCAILATFASFLAAIAPVHSTGGAGQDAPIPDSSASTQDAMSPTTGAAISTLLSISRGSMSICTKRWVPGLPQLLPLPCDSSQFSRAPSSSTTSASFSTVERAAAADCGCVSGSRPLAMLIGMYGAPLASTSRRIASSAWA